MKLKYIIVCALLFTVAACSDSSTSHSTEPDPDLEQPDTLEKPTNIVSIEKAVFTDPNIVNTKESDPQIMDSLIQYVDHTPKGGDIHISVYLFYYNPVVAAVRKASKRGVNVHVLLTGSRGKDEEKNKSTYRQFKNVFDGSSSVKWVYNDAAPAGKLDAIDHQKLVLFSKVYLPQGLAENVVFGTSHNFTKAGTKKAQDAIIITDERLYDAFLNNWEEIESRAESGMRTFEYTVAEVRNDLTVYFFPRRKHGTWDRKSTIVEQLEELDKDEFEQDTVRVLMASYSGQGGVMITKKLTELQEKGVTVQMIARNSSSDAVLTELEKLDKKGGYLKLIDTSTQGQHSKTMLIKGVRDGKKQNIILTGSHNFNSYALKYNNEFIFRLIDSPLFDDYWSNWNEIRRVY